MLMLGFMFDSWMDVHQHLTKEELPSDSGPVERYAEALGLEAIILDGAVFLGRNVCEAEEFDSGHYATLSLSDLSSLQTTAADIEEKLTATGLEVEGEAVILSIDYQ